MLTETFLIQCYMLSKHLAAY